MAPFALGRRGAVDPAPPGPNGPPRLVVHAGMHKTGSSSIQKTFANLDPARVDGKVAYVPWSTRNQSGAYDMAFLPNVTAKQSVLALGADGAELARRRDAVRAELVESLAERLAPTMLISGESISIRGLPAFRAFHETVRPHVASVEAIAYVRRPGETVASKTQQQIKAGKRPVRHPVMQRYRDGLSALDEVLGREAVDLRLFDRAALRDGDVVADIAAYLGVEVPPDAVVHANESLPLEALAILDTHCRHGRDRNAKKGDATIQSRFGLELRALGDTKFAFTPELIADLMAERRDDIDWISERIGVDMGAEVPQARGISDLSDLTALALRLEEPFRALLGARCPPERAGDLRRADALPPGEARIGAYGDLHKAIIRDELRARRGGPPPGPPGAP